MRGGKKKAQRNGFRQSTYLIPLSGISPKSQQACLSAAASACFIKNPIRFN